MHVTCAGVSHRGLVRNNNEDNIYIDGQYRKEPEDSAEITCLGRTRDYHTLAVFDGIGGAESGEMASFICAYQLKNMDDSNLYKQQQSYVQRINSVICRYIQEHDMESMGSTVALVSIVNDVMYMTNVGDSRIYIFRNNHLQQLSYDHTSVQSMIEHGLISEGERRHNKFRHTLTQYIGYDGEYKLVPYTKAYRLRSDDILLLCSDGLTDMVDDDEISEIIKLNRYRLPETMAEKLLSKALESGGRDNVSVVVAVLNDYTSEG